MADDKFDNFDELSEAEILADDLLSDDEEDFEIVEENEASSNRKVELDTAGLDLDIFDEEPKEEPENDIEQDYFEEEEEDTEIEPEKPKTLIYIIIGGMALLMAVVVILVVTFVPKEKKHSGTRTMFERAAMANIVVDNEKVLALETFTIPLEKQKAHLVRMNIQLEVAPGVERDIIENEKLKIRDVIYRTLLAKNTMEMKGKKARADLRKMIKVTINEEFEGDPVKEVYFTDFIVF